MRPERLEVAGFGVFREPVEIDFGGTDLFALSGPTGSGKSTVIDAIVFALYGSVPRYDDKRKVGAAISEGKVEARVRLDFSVAGVAHTAVRVVRRNPRGGASTAEARLERVGPGAEVEVLAGTADEVTTQVEALLGLTYDHFTTCVVLPQGDFQRFLHQRPADRQDLLVELLDLGVYGQMASAARDRAKVADGQRAWVLRQLEDLAGFSPELQATLEWELVELGRVLDLADDVRPALEACAARAAAARAEAEAADARAGLLDGVHLPDGVAALADDLAAAADRVTRARQEEDAAADGLAAAEAALAALGSRAELDAALVAHDDRAKEAERIANGTPKLADAEATVADARADLETARDRQRAAADALDGARQADRVRDLVAALVVGDPCPVCRQPVGTLPHHELGDLPALTAAEAAAAADLADREATVAQLESTRTRMADLLTELHGRVAALDERLAAFPDRTAVLTQVAATDAATEAVTAARTAEQQARKARQRAEADHTKAGAAEQDARRAFDAARDALAALGPPPAERRDLLADWSALLAWATEELPVQRGAAATARAEVDAAEAEAAQQRRALDDACRAAGVEPDPRGRPVRDTVVELQANARADLDSVIQGLERRDELAAEDARLVEVEQTATALAGHLKANAFEKWVLDEVLQRLVAGATGILYELSGGTYSLTFDKRSEFSVVDHANADAVRSARTLSGGETFLASLALALALADEVAQLAAGGSVRLESIFLDEGFGTLDPGTLDTVASAIEELGASGRLVGLVTHVRDLAERMPVRFDVVRAGNASTVTRIES